MDPLLPLAPWLATAAGVVAAVACLLTWKAVPWQGRQTVLVMAGVMVVAAVAGGSALVGLLSGAVLLASAMLGVVGVRGTEAAADCVQRSVIALVMAVCSFESASSGLVAEASGSHSHGGPALSGALPVIATIGVVGVILWTIVADWIVQPRHEGRTARLLAVESWALTAGLAVVCLAL